MASTAEEQLAKIYESQLAAQKEQLQQDYTKSNSDLDYEKQQAQKTTDANLTRTAVESQKAAVSNAEYYNANGLSSGARAQARLAQENQLQADLTALRAQQQETDAEVERQRTILAQEYASAIRQAQAENDLAKAQALYEQAQKEQEALLSKQENAAQLMANAGDYTRIAAIYGLSDAEVAALQSQNQPSTASGEYALDAAKLMAEAGDYSRLAAIYGLSSSELATLMGESSGAEPSETKSTVDLTPKTDAVFQNALTSAIATAGTAGVSGSILNKVKSFTSNADLANYLDDLTAAGTITESKADALYAQYKQADKVALSERDWKLTDNGGVNWFGGVDNNATVKDQYGNTYRLDKLVDALVAEGMSKSKAKEYVKNLQKKLGA